MADSKDNENQELLINRSTTLDELSNWVNSQLTLPNDLDYDVLSTFLDYGGDDVFQLISDYYKARQHYKKVFRDRPPGSDCHLRFTCQSVAAFTLPTTPQHVVLGTWFTENDPSDFNTYHTAKLIFTEIDLLLQEGCLAGKSISIVVDMAHITENHLRCITKFSGLVIGKLLRSIPAKIDGGFVINAPPWISRFTILIPGFNFHLMDSLEDLTGFISPSLLPSDLGGLPTNPTREECEERFKERLRQYSSWLAHEEVLRDEELLILSTTEPITIPEKKEKKTGKKKRGKAKKK